VLRFIDEHITEVGYPPSIAQIRDAVGVSSTSTIAHHMEFLVARKYITKVPGQPRTLVITGKGRELLDRKASCPE